MSEPRYAGICRDLGLQILHLGDAVTSAPMTPIEGAPPVPDAVFLSSPSGHRLTFRSDLLEDMAELIAPESYVARGAAPDTFEISVPAELLRRLVVQTIEAATFEPAEDSSDLDLELLRRLASGVGGARTGALKRAGLLEWKITPRGTEALNAASMGEPVRESRTVEFARDELRRAGMFDADADYGGELGEAILDVVRAFCGHGHSGGSASIALAILERLLRHKPLTPITSDPDEWLDISEMMDGPLWQNRRSPSCFSMDGGASWYDQDGDDRYDVLRGAGLAVRHLHPGRKVARISRLQGLDGIAFTFADDPVTHHHLNATEVLAAWGAAKGPAVDDTEPTGTGGDFLQPIVTPSE